MANDKLSFSEYVLKSAHKKPLIGVIGAGNCDERIYKLAYNVGKEIAIREGIIVCGGLYGVMEACCKGAKEVGGVTIGILPGKGYDECNDYIDLPIATGMGIARNSIIAHTCRTAIAIDGKYGTLSEIGYFLQLGKKVFGIETWDIDGIITTNSVAESVEKAFEEI